MQLRSKNTWLRTLGALAVVAGALDAAEPVPVILDTDMDSDCETELKATLDGLMIQPPLRR